MKTRNSEILVGALTVLLGVVCLTYLIPNYISAGYGGGLSPRTFPYICAWAITVLSVCLVANRLWAASRGGDPGEILVNGPMLLRVAAGAAALVVSLALIQYVSYLVGGTVMVALYMLLMGERRPLPLIGISVVWSGFLWVLFEKILETPLS